MEENKSEVALREEKVMQFWREHKTFEKSLEKDAPKGNYVFYDGPPFATGQMHYGHILGSTAKDVIGRYQTMQGYHVPRKWGWDCHGLPIENIVEADLKVAGHVEIEKLGIDKFVEHARSKVLEYDADWRRGIERIGRWVDFDGGYKTMDNTFIESVWWALSEFYKKNLIYEGVRVLAYCARCETPIANSEIAMDNSYKDIADISVYVKFELVDEPGTYLLAWTTTPWTLPGNTAIAVNKDIRYVKAKVARFTPANSLSGGEPVSVSLDYEYLIFAKDRVEDISKKSGKEFKSVEEIEINEYLGKKYKPVFPYYENTDMPNKENIYKVWHADFVTNDQGTGIAHEAPAFGEDDMNLAKANNIPWIIHVDEEGKFKDEVKDFAGLKVKPKDTKEDKDAHLRTDIEVIKYLQASGAYFAKEKITHSYPHCMRCDTPIIYYALPSWFINIQKEKERILKNAESMHWVPEHLKDGRFKHIAESAPDWNISRNRYWASPLPIWKCDKCKKQNFLGSVSELKEKRLKSGNKYFVMRHGGTEGNRNEVVSYKNQAEDNLTEEGRAQVLSSAHDLKSNNIDLIITSHFTRTKESAEIVRQELGLGVDSVVEDPRLCEINPGDFDGGSWNDYHNHVKATGQNWFDRQISNGESLKDVKRRTAEALYEMEEKYKGKNILIVTHGAPAWLLFVNTGMFEPDHKEYVPANTHIFVKEFKRFVNGEVRELPFVPLPHNKDFEYDLHRPYIDDVVLACDCGGEMKRIPEVLDCWFESGSMPFAQDHFPFENPDWQKNNFPAGFVAEYIAQTRTWFYYTHVVSSILFDHAPFKNVVTTGTVRAEDGQKMSKSKKNFPDPWVFIDKYGSDALRLYLMSSSLMKGEDANFSEKLVQEISSKVVGRFSNTLAFYELYRDKSLEKKDLVLKSENVLDKWILARLNQTASEITSGMEAYDMALATRPIEGFVDDLSTWYLRRSRDRIKDGEKEAKETLYFVLKTFSKIVAPFMPFIAESVWQILRCTDEAESVHLAEWPKQEFVDGAIVNGEPVLATITNIEFLQSMEFIRSVIEAGHRNRQILKIPVRQPLGDFSFFAPISDIRNLASYYDLIKEELNIENIFLENDLNKLKLLELNPDWRVEDAFSITVAINHNITPELKIKGNYRELVRAVQDMRKTMGLKPSEMVQVSLSENAKNLVEKFKDDFVKTVGAKELVFAENDGTEVKIGELVFVVQLSK